MRPGELNRISAKVHVWFGDDVSLGDRAGIKVKKAVLQVAANPVTKLEIMNRAYLTDLKAGAMIEELMAEGLLERKPGSGRYITTEAGKKWLDTVR